MSEEKRIVVDIGEAAAALQASPELCAMMNELVGGPALVEAQAEIEFLRELLRHADGVVIWEHTSARPGFQEEIEAALGIQPDDDAPSPSVSVPAPGRGER